MVGYAIFAFAVLQVSEPIMHGAGLPDWVLKAVLVALAVGFPVALLMAWLFDLTAQGVRRTPPARELGGIYFPRRRLAALLVVVALVGALPGVAWYLWKQSGERGHGAPIADAPPSIAVLPFVDMSAAKDQEYFADGIAEEILNALAHVRGLRVIGRTSSFAFKGKPEDLRSIGRKLDVAAVLEGSVRREGGRVRITAQLIQASNGSHLWSESYDREVRGIFQAQDEIARAVVAALLPSLVGRSQGAPPATPATSPDAYNQFLIGRQFLGQFSADSSRRAAQAFEKALALDGSYAPAWAGLAEALFLRIDNSAEDPRPHLERARVAADRAVAIAPQLAEGYHVRNLIRRLLWDWDGALADAERAVAMEPGSANSIRRRALVVLETTGNGAQVVEQFRYATQLDPLSANSWTGLGNAYHLTGQTDLARQAYLRALEIVPDHQWAVVSMVANELAAGNPEEARGMAARVEQPSARLWWDAIFAQKHGEKALAREATEQFAVKYGNVDPYGVAQLHAVRGEPDLAFEWLDRSLSQRQPAPRELKGSWPLQPLHGDPRWKALLRKMNLPVD